MPSATTATGPRFIPVLANPPHCSYRDGEIPPKSEKPAMRLKLPGDLAEGGGDRLVTDSGDGVL